MTSTDTATHHPMILIVGTVDCLERECEEYVTEDGENDPGVERCSHLREETVCAACSGPENDGLYEHTVPWPCPLAPAAVSSEGAQQ